MLLVLLACWSPAPFVPPPPAQVEASDVLEGTAAAIAPGAEAAEEAPVEGEGTGDEAGDQGEPEPGTPEAEAPAEPEAPPVPTDVPVSPYEAHTVGRPITLVGDDGAPVQVITQENAVVTVLAEGVERVKVRCLDCRPVVEGWLQRRTVAR